MVRYERVGSVDVYKRRKSYAWIFWAFVLFAFLFGLMGGASNNHHTTTQPAHYIEADR